MNWVDYCIDAAVRAPYLALMHALAHINKLADTFGTLAVPVAGITQVTNGA